MMHRWGKGSYSLRPFMVDFHDTYLGGSHGPCIIFPMVPLSLYHCSQSNHTVSQTQSHWKGATTMLASELREGEFHQSSTAAPA